jgi:hypothetical protein
MARYPWTKWMKALRVIGKKAAGKRIEGGKMK